MCDNDIHEISQLKNCKWYAYKGYTGLHFRTEGDLEKFRKEYSNRFDFEEVTGDEL